MILNYELRIINSTLQNNIISDVQAFYILAEHIISKLFYATKYNMLIGDFKFANQLKIISKYLNSDVRMTKEQLINRISLLVPEVLIRRRIITLVRQTTKKEKHILKYAIDEFVRRISHFVPKQEENINVDGV